MVARCCPYAAASFNESARASSMSQILKILKNWKLDMYSGYSEWEIWNGSSDYTYTSFCWRGVSKWNFGIFLDLGHLGTINDRACDTWHGCPPEILGKDGMFFLKGQSCNGWSRSFFGGSRSNSGSDVLTCFGQDGGATKWENHRWYSYII